jgi:hypothetical protein
MQPKPGMDVDVAGESMWTPPLPGGRSALRNKSPVSANPIEQDIRSNGVQTSSQKGKTKSWHHTADRDTLLR